MNISGSQTSFHRVHGKNPKAHHSGGVQNHILCPVVRDRFSPVLFGHGFLNLSETETLKAVDTIDNYSKKLLA